MEESKMGAGVGVKLPEMPGRAKMSKAAVWSLVLGLAGFLIPLVTSIPGIILGVAGWRGVNRSAGQVKGKGLAMAGVIVSAMSLCAGLTVVLAGTLYYTARAMAVADFDKTGGYRVLCMAGSGEQIDKEVMKEICSILYKRLDPKSLLGIIIRPKNGTHVEICVPTGNRFAEPQELARIIGGFGALEFRMLPADDEETRRELSAYQERLTADGPDAEKGGDYVWLPIEDAETFKKCIVGAYEGQVYVLCSNRAGEVMLQDGSTKWRLLKSHLTQDEQGRYAIGFTFDEAAANLFYELTSNNIGEPLCILLDGRALSAPRMNSAIRSAGIITGQFTQTEAMDMVNILNAGTLPMTVTLVEGSAELVKPAKQ